MPSDAKFWNRLAHSYAAKPIADQESYEHKLAIAREYFHPDSRVLELGCGTGSTALLHAPLVKHIRAVDFSSKMIDIAKEKATRAAIHNVDFACNSTTGELLLTQTFDVVMALNVLHLLSDWRETIDSVHESLSQGGIFVTSTHCLSDSAKFLRWIAPLLSRLRVFPHLAFFTRTALEVSLVRAGFDIEYAWRPNPKAGVFLVARKAS